MNNYIDDIKFEINEKDELIFEKNLENYKKIIDQIKNFDFSKYAKYLENKNDEYISFSELRKDEPTFINEEKRQKLLCNSIEFADGYVVLKNEK